MEFAKLPRWETPTPYKLSYTTFNLSLRAYVTPFPFNTLSYNQLALSGHAPLFVLTSST